MSGRSRAWGALLSGVLSADLFIAPELLTLVVAGVRWAQTCKESTMKVKDLVKWLEENTGPEDDIALLDLSDPQKNRDLSLSG